MLKRAPLARGETLPLRSRKVCGEPAALEGSGRMTRHPRDGVALLLRGWVCFPAKSTFRAVKAAEWRIQGCLAVEDWVSCLALRVSPRFERPLRS